MQFPHKSLYSPLTGIVQGRTKGPHQYAVLKGEGLQQLSSDSAFILQENQEKLASFCWPFLISINKQQEEGQFCQAINFNTEECITTLFSILHSIDEYKLMELIPNPQDQLLTFLEKQCQETLQVQRYYQKLLAQLIQSKNQRNFALLPSVSQVESPSQEKARPMTKRQKTEEPSSFMQEGNVSINLKDDQKRKRKVSKRQALSFDMQYQLLAKELNKLIDSLSNKDNTFRKTPIGTPKKVLATQIATKSQLQPQVSGFKLTGSLSAMPFNKTEREQGHEQRDQLLHDLGDTSAIISSDQVVCKLSSNLRLEQQRFADALLQRSRMSAMNKMKNYLDHLAQKNEQTLFKLKQTAIDRSLSKLQGNKQTVRSGYTRRMRQAIQNGL